MKALIVSWMARLILAAVFIYAAILKIGSPLDFADSIAAYQLLPAAAINILALGLPIFELVCGILVLTGLFLRVGTLGILAMLGIFTVAIITALIRGLNIDCGCFGSHSWLDSSPWIALIRDLILIGLSLLVYRHQFRSKMSPALVL